MQHPVLLISADVMKRWKVRVILRVPIMEVVLLVILNGEAGVAVCMGRVAITGMH